MANHDADEIRETAVEYGEQVGEPLPFRGPKTTRSAVERLTASGRLRPARGDLRDLGPPPDEPHVIPITEALNEQRSE